MELEDLVAQAAATTSQVRPFTRKRPVCQPWPENIGRKRVVLEAPKACACCGGLRLAKIGKDVTEPLGKSRAASNGSRRCVRSSLVGTARRSASRPRVPSHAARHDRPTLVATILFDKFDMHIPLNRQSGPFKSEGLDVSRPEQRRGRPSAMAQEVADLLRAKLPKLSGFMDEAETDVLAYMAFPPDHRPKLHSTNGLERPGYYH